MPHLRTLPDAGDSVHRGQRVAMMPLENAVDGGENVGRQLLLEDAHPCAEVFSFFGNPGLLGFPLLEGFCVTLIDVLRRLLLGVEPTLAFLLPLQCSQCELFALLDRGGVIGGGSAGAHIQGEVMNVSRSPEREFSERTVPEEMWRKGFGFLKGVIVDVHVLARNRQFDLIGVLEHYPEMLGIGIDENTAIVVRNDQFEVIGTSYVTIHDDQKEIPPDPPETMRTVGGSFYFLRPGDRYNLVTREASRPSRSSQPIGRVSARGG